ncbi:MAG: Asp-tRNA(Asn)/Glu-tRNA(Gln) amidotransferase subunit GatC [Peptococcaceae bacterium]|nr:Asp-tRNA(Asn)/Glu-tRNA(Gln) amidotransferase subunit GatC [Peptococcaceae bacterium]
MIVTKETVMTLAGLAKIGLSEAELERLAAEIGDMSDFADKLAGLDTEGVTAATHTIYTQSIYRDDIRVPALPREELLANAAEHDESCFLTPRVLDEG